MQGGINVDLQVLYVPNRCASLLTNDGVSNRPLAATACTERIVGALVALYSRSADAPKSMSYLIAFVWKTTLDRAKMY